MLSDYYNIVPNLLEQGFQADATTYFGTVHTTDPIGTVVFPIRIIIDLNNFTNHDLTAIVVNLVQNNLVQRIFRFSDGTNARIFFVEGGLFSGNASEQFPEISLIDNRFVAYEDNITYQEAPPSNFELPITLTFELNVLVVGQVTTEVQEQSPFATGIVALGVFPPGISYGSNL